MIKITVEPGAEWTDEDRFRVILELAAGLKYATREISLPREVVFDAAERINFLITTSPLFLEANRDAILNGQVVTNIKL